jgi:hypothetical protein
VRTVTNPGASGLTEEVPAPAGYATGNAATTHVCPPPAETVDAKYEAVAAKASLGTAVPSPSP